MTDPAEGRRNVLFGWALFVISLVLFAGTFGVALIYLAAD